MTQMFKPFDTLEYTNTETCVGVWLRTLVRYNFSNKCYLKRGYMVYLEHEMCDEHPFSVLVFSRRPAAQKMFRILRGMVEQGVEATDIRKWFLSVDYKTMGVMDKRNVPPLCDVIGDEYFRICEIHAKRFGN